MEKRKHENCAIVLGLAVACPHHTSLDECPANDLRVLPLCERIARIKAMSENDLVGIIAKHETCLSGRDAADDAE